MVNRTGRPKEFKGHTQYVGAILEIETIPKLDKAAIKEHVTRSEIIRMAVEEWLKTHPSNPSFSLDNWKGAPEVKAYPTPWKALGKSDLEGYNDKEIHDMIRRLKANVETLENIQRMRK